MIYNFRLFNTKTHNFINISKDTHYSDVMEVAKAYATSIKDDVIVTIQIEDKHNYLKSLTLFVAPNGTVRPYDSICQYCRGGYNKKNEYRVEVINYFKYF